MLDDQLLEQTKISQMKRDEKTNFSLFPFHRHFVTNTPKFESTTAVVSSPQAPP